MEKVAELLYNHLCQQETDRLVSENKTEEFNVPSDEIAKLTSCAKERIKIKLKSGKCSSLLIGQMVLHMGNYGEKFKDKIEYYNASEIFDLVENIENGKVSGTDFERDILNGFSHIHHGSYASIGYNIVRNVKEYWFKKKRIRNEKINDFKQIVEQFGTSNISAIAITMHNKAIFNKDLRGEWLIYKNMNGLKYYLCLATHGESDEFIYNEKIKPCLVEFPGLETNNKC
ncbi:hypothetical protein [Breznakibacter xylanolyticus]|nr:hypothetical protein [Breznakibacter xylanolyticus]